MHSEQKLELWTSKNDLLHIVLQVNQSKTKHLILTVIYMT